MQWLTSIVAFVIIYLIRVLIHKPKRKNMGDAPAVLPEKGPGSADALTEDCADRLRRRGMEKLLLQDFVFQTKLTKAECGDLGQLQGKLRPMMSEVLKYLSLPPLSLHVYPANENTKTDRLGEYDRSKQAINFYVRGKYEPEQYAAALCHECTHCFMDRYGLDDWTDRPLNERRTDVMSCMIGFGKIMFNGYMVMVTAHYEVVGWSAEGQKVGYINAKDVKKILQLLKPIRKRASAHLSEAKELEAARKQLDGHLKGAAEMLSLAQSLYAVNKAPLAKKLSHVQLSRLQRSLYSLETGELAQRLKSCSTAEKGSLESIRRADREAMSLCETLNVILSAFQ